MEAFTPNSSIDVSTLIAEQIDLKAGLEKFFGFESFKGQQEEIIHHVMEGNRRLIGVGRACCAINTKRSRWNGNPMDSGPTVYICGDP